MNSISVSVLMSVYNEEDKYLKESIESILNQTFHDFEFIIIVDNPKNERIRSLLKDYCKRDDRVKIVINAENVGLTKSLNIGLKHCSGKYIARMDADDISMPLRIAKQYSFMEEHPDVSVIGSNAVMIDENGLICGKIDRSNNSDKLKCRLIVETPILHPTAMFLRLMDGTPVYYDEHYKYAQDYALWVSMYKKKFSNIQEPLLKYRKSANQITQKKRVEQLSYTHEIQMNAVKNMGLNLDNESMNALFAMIGEDDNDNSSNLYNHFLKNLKQINETKVDVSYIIDFVLENYKNYLISHKELLQGLIEYIPIICRIYPTKPYKLVTLLSLYVVSYKTTRKKI